MKACRVVFVIVLLVSFAGSGFGTQLPPHSGGAVPGQALPVHAAEPGTAAQTDLEAKLNAGGSGHAYVIIFYDLFGNTPPGVVPEWLAAISLLRKFARNAGVPEDHIITISRVSAQWIKAIALPTHGVDPSTLPGSSSPARHKFVGAQNTDEAARCFAREYNLYEFPGGRALNVKALPGSTPNERFENVVQEWKQRQGIDLFEEFDYFGEELFRSDTLRDILNGKCPRKQLPSSHGHAQPCKVVPLPTHKGETHSVLVWTVLHGSDPFRNDHQRTELRKLDVFGLLPTKHDEVVDWVAPPGGFYAGDDEAPFSSKMYFQADDEPTREAVLFLFTTDITNEAVRNGQMVVHIGSCYGSALVKDHFEKLTDKTEAEQGNRVSTMFANQLNRHVLKTDKVLFFANQDRYLAYLNRPLMNTLVSSDINSLPFGALTTQVRLRGKDAGTIGPVVKFLREHAAELAKARDARNSDSKVFAEKAAWLRAELEKDGRRWSQIAYPKQLSIIARLGVNGRVRLSPDTTAQKLGAWGSRRLFLTTIGDFMANRVHAAKTVVEQLHTTEEQLRGISFINTNRKPHAVPEAFYVAYFDRDREYQVYENDDSDVMITHKYDMYRPRAIDRHQKNPAKMALASAGTVLGTGAIGAAGATFVLDQCAQLVVARQSLSVAAFYVPIVQAALYNAGATLSPTAWAQMASLAKYLHALKDPVGHAHDLHVVFDMAPDAAARVAQMTCEQLVKLAVDEMVRTTFWRKASTYASRTPTKDEELRRRIELATDDLKREVDEGY